MTLWNGLGADNLLTTPLNWVGGVAPVAGGTLDFDGTGVKNCDINSTAAFSAINILTGYTGTITSSVSAKLGPLTISDGVFNGGNVPLEIEGYTQSGGVFNSTSNTLSVISGDFIRSAGTFNHSLGQVDFSFNAVQNIDNTSIVVFNRLRIAKLNFDLRIVDQKVQVSSRLIIDNAAGSISPQLDGEIELIDNAVLEQNGNLYSQSATGGLISFSGNNHEWIQNATADNSQLAAIKVDCTDLTLTVSDPSNVFGMWKLEWLSGTITNSETSNFKNSQTSRHTTYLLYQTLEVGSFAARLNNFDLLIYDETGMNPATIIVNGLTRVTDVTSGSQFLGGDIEVRGTYEQVNASIGPGAVNTGSLLFTGAGNQDVSITGATDEIISGSTVVNKPSGALRQLTSINVYRVEHNFQHLQGLFNPNGFDLNVEGDCAIDANCADLSGVAITVGGNFSANNAILEGASAWSLTVNGTSNGNDCVVKNCDASGGTRFDVVSSTDNGGNVNVNFIEDIKYWIGAGAGLASDDTRWSLASGGINDTVAPTINDGVVFDSGGLGACDWNLTEIAFLGIISGYTSVVTMSVAVHVRSDLTIVSDVGQDFVTEGNDLRVSGDYSVTGSGAGITHNAGGTIYWSGDVFQQLGLLLSPVVVDGGLLTPTVAKTHLIEIPGNNPRPHLLTIKENQHIQISSNDIRCGEITLEPNTTIEGLSVGSSLTVFNGIINPHLCTWFGPSINDLYIALITNVIGPADYGNARVALQETATVSGAYITLGDFFFSSNGSTQTYTMFGSVDARGITVGGPFPSRAATLIQKSGSRITASGDVIIRSDDGIEKNLWTREAGALDTVINGNLNIQTLAGIDWSADTGMCEVFGGIAVHSSAVCDFGLSTIRHYAGIENPTSINEFYNVITNVSNNTAMPTGTVRISGMWSFEGAGDFDWNNNDVTIQGLAGNILAGASNVNFIYKSGSLLTLRLINTVNGGISYLEGADYNVEMLIRPRNVGGANTVVILGDVGLGAGDLLFNNHGLDLNGFTFSCARVDDFFGWYTIDLNGGNLKATGDIQLELPATSISGAGRVESADLIHADGEIDLAGAVYEVGSYVPTIGGSFSLSGAGTLSMLGDFNAANASSADMELAGMTLVFTGVGTQEYNIGSTTDAPALIQVTKPSGVLEIRQDQSSSTDIEFNATLGSASVQFLAGIVYNFKAPVSRGVPGNKTSIMSSAPATKIGYIFQAPEMPAMRYVGWKDSDVQGIIQNVDTDTGSDDGNNTIAGAEGLNFGSFPPISGGKSYGYGTPNAGVGCGEGEGLGSAYGYGST